MKRNVTSLKAVINNIAKKNKISAQSVLQTYMLERLLERISVSPYKDNFILKGGMLISAMLGIDSRTTMDMDTTIKGFSLTEENVRNIISEICSINLDDDVSFEVQRVELIRDDDEYGGYRITFKANYLEKMPVILNIDDTILKDAIYSTSEHRGTLEIIKEWKNIVDILAESDTMKKQWDRYQKNNFYADGISYEDLIESLTKVGQLL